jgi:hypothetical protein
LDWTHNGFGCEESLQGLNTVGFWVQGDKAGFLGPERVKQMQKKGRGVERQDFLKKKRKAWDLGCQFTFKNLPLMSLIVPNSRGLSKQELEIFLSIFV